MTKQAPFDPEFPPLKGDRTTEQYALIRFSSKITEGLGQDSKTGYFFSGLVSYILQMISN